MSEDKLLILTSKQRCGSLYQNESCCRDFFARAVGSPAADLPGPLVRAPAVDFMKVALWATTSHEYENLLRWFVESATHFWPFERWRSELVLVMESESVGDRRYCNRTLAPHVRCVLAPPPPGREPDVIGSSYFFSRGLTRATWNNFFADLHVGPGVDWIALGQPDVVFMTDFIPETLFDWSGPKPRPIIFGGVVPQFVTAALVLGFSWVAEFMDGVPMLVRPEHLRGLRRYMIKVTGAANFGQAFHLLIERGHHFARKRSWTHTANSNVVFEPILGHYLYSFHRDDYFWSIRDGASTGVPLRHTCPSLRPAAHLAGGRCKATGTKRLAKRSETLHYAAEAVELMKGGVKGLAGYPDLEPEPLAVADWLAKAAFLHWGNTSDAWCGERTIDGMLRTVASWYEAEGA